tara:strand:+ start:6438 stop:8585 length:2148 start_codon:yes stop_codon:yes gene_type:complete
MATKKVNIDIIARDKSQQALNKVRGNLDGVKKAVFNVRNALAGLGAGLAVRSLVKTGMEIESLQVRLKFLFGSAEEGAKAFDNMAKFASKVPFSLQQIQQGAGVLSVVSKDADELSNIMEITGNVAAVTGLDFRTASEQIQRSLSAGIASADLFREKGVRDLLGFKAGATVTAEETAEAFKRVFGKGGKFGDATGELAKTFEGTLSMIGDKFFTFKKTILEAGFFSELKKQFGDLDKFLSENTETIEEFAITIGKGLAQAVTTGAEAIIFLKDNFDLLLDVMQFFIGIKVAKMFLGMSAAIATANSSMLLFNATIKRNLFIAGAAIVVSQFDKIQSALGKLPKDFDNVSEAIENNNVLIKHYENELKTAEGVIKSFEGQVGVSEETLAEHTATMNDAIVKLRSLREQNVALKNSQNEHMKVQNEVIIKNNENTDAVKDQTEKVKILKENIGLLDGDYRDLHGTLLATHEANKNLIEIFENQEHPMKAITDQLKKEEEQLQRTMEVYKEFAMQRRRLSLQTFRDEREQAKNNQQKMFDDALANESKMVELKENTKKLTMEKGRELIAELAKNNREMFMINKALAVKDAIMATAQGITNALKLGPIGIPLAAIIGGLGAVQIATIARQQYQGRQGGGSVNKNQAYMVGETGPEMFVPSGSGKIVPNNKVGNSQPVTVNFNINTVDARGFNELLVNSRGVIINMINSAVNEKGRMAIV